MHETDSKKSISMPFAVSQSCTLADLTKRTSHRCRMPKGWKIPLELLSSDTSQLIDGEYII